MLPTCVMVSTVWSINFRIVSTALLVFGILSDQMSYQAAAIDMRQVSIPANWCEKATTPNNTGSNGSNMLIWAPLQQKKAGSEPDSAVVILFYFVLFWRNTFYFIKLDSLWEAASIGHWMNWFFCTSMLALLFSPGNGYYYCVGQIIDYNQAV